MRMRLAAGLLVCTLVPDPACAQERAGGTHAIGGLAVGLGSVPGAFIPTCTGGFDGGTLVGLWEGRLGFEHGRVGIEARTLIQTEVGPRKDCLVLDPIYDTGTGTVRRDASRRDAVRSTELRFRYAVPLAPVTLILAAGPGWVWSSDVTTVSVGAGIRSGSRLRFALDFDVMGYRTAWDDVTADWDRGSIVRLIARERVHEWRSGVAGRIGIEFPFPG